MQGRPEARRGRGDDLGNFSSKHGIEPKRRAEPPPRGEGVGRGHQASNAAPCRAVGPSPERNKDCSKARSGATFQLCPTRTPTPKPELGSRGATRRHPAGPRGCLACSKLFESSRRHPRKCLAQALDPTSPRPLPASSFPTPPRRARPLPARSAPEHSHGPRGARGHGAAAAAGVEPRSGRVRQGGWCSPRGGAAPSGRARVWGGGSCNSGWAGGSAPSCGERAGPGGARVGLGRADGADSGETRDRAAGGGRGRGRGDRGPGGARV